MTSISPMPVGTVTFLFTDIEGSTRLWELEPEAMPITLARHDALMREAIVGANGRIFKTVGDAFCAAFATAPEAVTAALRVQLVLAAEPWRADTPIKVRMALHTGAVERRDHDFFGAPVNRVARLLATGHGGQTLLSQATYELSRDALPDGVSLRDLGTHKLKDLSRPEQVFQLLHPELPAEFPPIKSLSTHPNNLPQQLSTFIGRAKEIVEIEALLAKTRLVTLTGAGGSGKTRLTLQVAAEVLERFPDGVWFVELAALTEPGLVPGTVAAVLGLREAPDKAIMQTLVEDLASKRLLLLLDNCEHVLDACAGVADTIVRQCSGVKILASSREALGIAGEQIYRVPSLSLPDRRRPPTPQALSAYESVQLFIDRALLVRADFEVTNRNAPALASLCFHLDGIPLAIELAAARVRSLSVEEIDAKLDQRFRLLTGGSRTAMPRQQTLRSAIDWSYDLLREPERRLLQRLSVFAGGWTLGAAEQVCAGDGVAIGDVLDLMTSLADKSLVVVEHVDGRSRYRLLETVRQYAWDWLVETGDGEAVRERHWNYFLALAEEVEPKLMGAEQAAWLQRLEDEHENLRVSLDWSLAATGSGAVQLCGALQKFWFMRGHFSEGREWCARVLGKAGSKERTPERAKVLNAAGILAYCQDDYADARARHEESLALVRELGDRSGIARSLNNLGNVCVEQRDYPAARALLEECLTIRRELGDRSGIAAVLNSLGNIADDQGDYHAARALHEESLAIERALGDRSGIARSLGNLGAVARALGDLVTAWALYEECLAIMRELEDRSGIAECLGKLAPVAYQKGDYPAACALYVECLPLLHELGERRSIAYALQEMGEMVAALGNSRRAARIWGAAERLREDLGSPLQPAERSRYDLCVASARRALDDDAAFDRAWLEGRSLTLAQAVELALTETPAPGLIAKAG